MQERYNMTNLKGHRSVGRYPCALFIMPAQSKQLSIN